MNHRMQDSFLTYTNKTVKFYLKNSFRYRVKGLRSAKPELKYENYGSVLLRLFLRDNEKILQHLS